MILKMVAAFLCMVGVASAEVQAPDVLISNTVREVISVIKQDKDIRAGDQKKTLALVESKVLPHFDFNQMMKSALGQKWRKASVDQQQTLVVEFRNMLVRTYTKAFTVYRDQTVEVKPLKLAPGAEEATVKTTINKPGAPAVLVDYEMKKAADEWKVVDLSIEGVSMVNSYRGTFSTQVEKNGIEGLIKMLSDKNTNAAQQKAETK